MASNTIFTRLYTAGTGLTFSCAVLLALAANFLWAEGHDQQRCIELVVLSLALLYTLANGAVPRSIQAMSLPSRILCLGFLLLGAAASVKVVSPNYAWGEWAMFVLLGLTALAVAAEIAASGMPGLNQLLQVLGLVCLLYSLRVLLVYSAGMVVQVPLGFHALAPGFSNARFLNHTQTALLPLLVLSSRQPGPARAPWLGKVYFVVAALWWALVFVTEGRATVLALLVAGIVALALRRRAAKSWLLAMAATAAAGLLLYLILFIVLPWALGMAPLGSPDNIIARSAADPASGRQFLWRRALELIAQHPWLGVGPQHFAHYGEIAYMGAHPHDWLLQIAVEWGIPALLCLLAILLLGARALARAAATVTPADRAQQDIATALIVAIAAIVVDALFSGVLVMPQSQIAIALAVGVVVGWVRLLQPVTVPAVTPITRSTVVVLGLLAVVLVAACIGPDVERKWQGAPLDARETAHNHNDRGLWPRLWGAGYF